MTEPTQMTPRAAVLQTEDRFLKSMPATMNFEAETGFAIQLLSNNKHLESVAQGNIASFQQAITNVAAIGLSLNPAEKLAYLLPRNVKIRKGVYESRVFLEPSYMGLMKLVIDSGSIKWVQSDVVHKEDTFTDHGPGNAPTHTYSPFAKPSERGPIIGSYCVAKTADGDFLTTTMTLEELEGIKARSEAGKKGYGPWVTDFAEQCKKTVVRRAFKMWPRSTGMERLAVAVDISNQNEGFEPIINNPNIEQATAEQNKYFTQLIEKDDAVGMFVFSQTMPPSVMASLNNSFPDGQITKFKNIVRQLESAGGATVNDWIASLNDCGGDSSKVAEFIESYPDAPDVIDYIRDQLSPEAQHFFNEAVTA